MRKHYHFIGIGGVGMSALAQILLKKGMKVSGSDVKESKIVHHLQHEGADVSIGHQLKNVKKADVVVFSTDIPENNIEIQEAQKRSVPLMHRSKLLAQMLAGKAPILVAGTHGKTSTSSLLCHILTESGKDPSFAVGGFINCSNINGRHGNGIYFVAEADESDGSFLDYPSFGAIITNLEHDHMTFWKTEEALLQAFATFANQVGSKDHLFWCKDDPLLESLKLKGHSFGFHQKADLCIESFQQINWRMSFDLLFLGKTYKNIEIPLIGAHNVLNAAAAFGMCIKLDVKEEAIRQGLESFQGVGRRIEKIGSQSDVEIYDDYAHHPTEIFATLRALRSATHGKKRIVVAFQPHRYSRTKYCMDDLADAFVHADYVIVTDIYAAREQPIEEITPQKILQRMQCAGFDKVEFVPREKLEETLSKQLKPQDLLITMGAGDITHVGPKVLNLLRKI